MPPESATLIRRLLRKQMTQIEQEKNSVWRCKLHAFLLRVRTQINVPPQKYLYIYIYFYILDLGNVARLGTASGRLISRIITVNN